MWDTVICSYEGFTGKRNLRKRAQIFSDLGSFFFQNFENGYTFYMILWAYYMKR